MINEKYAYKQEVIEHFKAHIRHEIAEIRSHSLEKMHGNCSNGFSYCLGSSMNEIILNF